MLVSNTTVFISWSQFYISCAALLKFHYFPNCKSFFPSSHIQKQHQDSPWPTTCTAFWSEKCGPSYLRGILGDLACILGCILWESKMTPGAWALVCGTFKATMFTGRIVMKPWSLEWEICDKEGWWKVKLLLKEKSDWAFKRPVSIQQYGAAIKWKKGSRQALS